MMATTSSNPKLSVAFSYGFLGGPLFAHRLKKFLKSEGYEWTSNLGNADIVIAHSAGCWYLKDLKGVKLLCLIGLPIAKPGWPTSFQSNKKRTANYLRHGHILQGLEANLLNIYYAVTQFKRNLKIIRNAKSLQNEMSLPKADRVVFIANQDDPWPGDAEIRRPYLENNPWAFISVKGSHDDIWENPRRYAEIVKHYAGLLAETSPR